MNKKLVITATVAMFLAGYMAISHEPSPAQAILDTKLDKKSLSTVGITLDIPATKPEIDEKTAIEKAKKGFGDLTSGATDVQVEYHLATNPNFTAFSASALDKNPALKNKKHMDKTPVYIVTFSGTSVPTFGPHGDDQGESRVHHVIHVVVDATTGEELLAFSNN